MGDIAKRKAWHQDPKLQLCTTLPDLELVLQNVRQPADITPGLLSRLYHSEYPSFIDAGKRKLNVPSNPNDLACLGEDSIGIEMRQRLLTPEFNLVRKPNSFVGLKNLGATCYMNCMLQALFHNTAFRAGLYEWQPQPGEAPSPIIRELQLLFAYLQRGARAYYDPTPFTTEIGLAPQVQQDVQEFFKALSTYLEEQFGQSSNPTVRTLVQDQFSGTMAYVTQCKACRTASKTRSLFYELDMTIDNVPSIERSIENYIKSEELHGSNQYHCSQCDSKRDAERFIELESLPPILNFQLMRFVFDWETETKKKVKTSVEFPELLDMTPYVRSATSSGNGDDNDDNDDTPSHEEPTHHNNGSSRRRKSAKSSPNQKVASNTLHYQLSYVLVHRGQSAYGGHYIAFVRDEATSKWWKFNDEEAEPVTDLAKALASNADIAPGVIKTTKKSASSQQSEVIDVDASEEETSKPKKSAAKKGAAAAAANQNSTKAAAINRYKSGSAYMLGYTRIGRPVSETVIPDEIVQDVDKKNASFQHVIDEQQKVLDKINEMIAQRKALRDQLLDVGLAAVPDDVNLPVLPGAEPNGRNHTKSGGKSKKKKMKEKEMEKNVALTDSEIQDYVTDQLEECQWISTEWWTSWLKGGKMARSDTDKKEEATEPPMNAESSDLTILTPPTASSAPQMLPNDLLMCEHARLDPLKVPFAKRISPQAWDLLADFSGSIGSSLDKHAMCTECAYQIIRYGADKNDSEKSKTEFLSALKTTDSSAHGIEPTFWISKDWLALYSKKTMKNSELDQTINSTLQCPHGKLSPDVKIRRRIPATQWVTLKSTFPAALEFPSVLTTAAASKPTKEPAKSSASTKASARSASATPPASAASVSIMSSFVVKRSAAAAMKTPSTVPFSSGSSQTTPIDLDEPGDPYCMAHQPKKHFISELDAITAALNDDGPVSPSHSQSQSPVQFDDQMLAAHSTDELAMDASGELLNHESPTEAMNVEPDHRVAVGTGAVNPPAIDVENESEEILATLDSKMDVVISPHPSQDSVSQGSATSVVFPKSPSKTVKSIASTPHSPKATAAHSNSGSKKRVPMNTYTEEEAELKDVCSICYHDMQEDSQARSELAKTKTGHRRRFKAFFDVIPSSMESRHSYNYCPLPTKPGDYYLVSLPWAIEWRTFLKEADLLKGPGRIDNAIFFCPHGRLNLRPISLFADTEKNVHFAVTNKAMWDDLRKEYGSSRSVHVQLSAEGKWDVPHMCEECMDARHLEKEVQAVNFVNADLFLVVEDYRSNKRRKTKLQENAMSRSRGSKKNFLPFTSYSDTVAITKMKIFEKYEIEPAEIVLVMADGKVLDNDEKTLEEYSVRSDTPLTVRLVDPTEREVYRAVDERNAGFGTTVLMGGQKRTAALATASSNGSSSNVAENVSNAASAPTGNDDPTDDHIGADLPPSSPQMEISPMEYDANQATDQHEAREEVQYRNQERVGVAQRIPSPEHDQYGNGDSFSQVEPNTTRINAKNGHDERRAPLKPSKEEPTDDDDDDDEDDDVVILGNKTLSSRDSVPPSPVKAERKVQKSERASSSAPVADADLVRESSSVDIGSWKCSACQSTNSGFLVNCEMCDTPSSKMNWQCSRCKIPIHAEFSRCHQCQMHRFQDDEFDYDEDIPERPNRAPAGSKGSKKRNRSREQDDDDFVPHEAENQYSYDERSTNSKKRKAKVEAEELEEEASGRISKRSKR